jgi:hypothetical protein
MIEQLPDTACIVQTQDSHDDKRRKFELQMKILRVPSGFYSPICGRILRVLGCYSNTNRIQRSFFPMGYGRTK